MQNADLYKIFFRCFLVQGSWNFKSLLGLGFCFSAIPIMKRLYQTPEEQSAFLIRHLTFFNAHPYFASWCLGAVAKLEEEALQRQWPDTNPITVFKERLAGPLGSIGDQYFWNGLKPLSSGLGVTLGILIGWLAIPVFFLVYNIPHIYIRFKGLWLGYKKGFDIISDLSLRKFSRVFQTLSTLGIFVAGLCVSVAAKWNWHQSFEHLAIFLITVVVTLLSLYRHKNVTFALVLSLLLGIALVVFKNLFQSTENIPL